MWRLPTHRDLVDARGFPMSESHWRALVELVAVVTAPGMDVEHAELLLENAQAILALSAARQGSDLMMPAPHAHQLRRLGLR